MSTVTVEEVFEIMGMGVIVAGRLQGRIKAGNMLLTTDNAIYKIHAIHAPNYTAGAKVGLLLDIEKEEALQFVGSELITCNQIEIVTAKKGIPFEVTLESNPTTGYLWHMEEHPMVTLQDKTFVGLSEEIGSGGIQTFTLLCEQVGKFPIVFTYKKNWGNEEGEEAGILLQVEE